jgi:hypothetical protein
VLLLLGAAVAGAELVSRRAADARARRRLLALAALGWTLASLSVVPRFAPRSAVGGDRLSPDTLYWHRYESSKLSFRELSLRTDVCGVALVGLHWAWSGGYTYLHHEVPLFRVKRGEAIAPVAEHANYLVAGGSEPAPPGPYTKERCWQDGGCLYRRPGGCVAKAGYALERELAVSRE